MNWPEVFKGIQLCLGFQLLIVAVFLFSSKQKRNKLLAFYTILISISSLSTGLYSYIENAPFVSFLFGAHLIIFHAPLLFLYIRSLGGTDGKTWPHLIFPLSYTLYYIIQKLYFSAFFAENGIHLLVGHLVLCVLITIVYFYFGSRFFSLQLEDSLKQKALKKFRLFYVITNLHSICLYTLMAISYITVLYYYDTFQDFNERIVPHIFSFIIYIHPITSIIFISYLLTETHSLQSLILDKRIVKHPSLIRNDKDIIGQIEQVIDVEKRFKNPSFNLSELAKEVGWNEKELAEYFNEEMSIPFSKYLNQKRISEFKRLLEEDTMSRYSMEGIADMAGFKSRATFFRVFKNQEGMTPAKYREKHLASIRATV